MAAILASPAAIAAKAFMVELVEGQTVVCDLTQERTHGRRVGWCYLDGQDVAEALVRAGLARDCPRFSGGQYAAAEPQQHASCRFRPTAGRGRPRALRYRASGVNWLVPHVSDGRRRCR